MIENVYRSNIIPLWKDAIHMGRKNLIKAIIKPIKDLTWSFL